MQTITDKNIFRLNLLPKGKARVTRVGIKFKGLFYGSEKAINEQWYIKLKNKSIDIVYDPRTMNQIYILHMVGRGFDSCFLLDTSAQYKGDSLEEIEFYQQLLQEAKAEELNKQRENIINTDAEIESIVKKAISEKKHLLQKRSSKRSVILK